VPASPSGKGFVEFLFLFLFFILKMLERLYWAKCLTLGGLYYGEKF
jgi:hypothetical protein